ncbi:hypothetical protein N1851_001477 [Merluccius polli]|uniref:Uncharacterized protein n=1 Tax=Merluccius polli TaxID=89951 RepID=A0AA47NCI3_MERPO|nr:hypothetical protein N1851_001477 [Merluccius polli]
MEPEGNCNSSEPGSKLRVELLSLLDILCLGPHIGFLKLSAAFGTDPIPWHCLRIFFERYRFSSEGIRYLIVLVGPYVGNATKRSRAQCVCVSLRFVATGTYCIQLVIPKI